MPRRWLAVHSSSSSSLDEAWADKLPAPLSNELELLECTASQRLGNSRLSCQIKLTDAMQGLLVRIPERQ